MNTARTAIIESARQWLGTRWKHQGRTKFGVDCAGLVILVGRELGYLGPDDDVVGYSRRPDGFTFIEAMRRYGVEKSLMKMQPGDVVTFRDGPYPCHMGILSEKFDVTHLIHSHAGLKVVLEQPYADWANRATHCFSYKGVE